MKREDVVTKDWFKVWMGVLVVMMMSICLIEMGVVETVMAEETDIDMMVDLDEDVSNETLNMTVSADNLNTTKSYDLGYYIAEDSFVGTNFSAISSDDYWKNATTTNVSVNETGYAEANYTIDYMDEIEYYLTAFVKNETGEVVEYYEVSFTFGESTSSSLTTMALGYVNDGYEVLRETWYMLIILIGSLLTIKMYWDFRQKNNRR